VLLCSIERVREIERERERESTKRGKGRDGVRSTTEHHGAGKGAWSPDNDGVDKKYAARRSPVQHDGTERGERVNSIRSHKTYHEHFPVDHRSSVKRTCTVQIPSDPVPITTRSYQ
jgi:hypothetical protein